MEQTNFYAWYPGMPDPDDLLAVEKYLEDQRDYEAAGRSFAALVEEAKQDAKRDAIQILQELPRGARFTPEVGAPPLDQMRVQIGGTHYTQMPIQPIEYSMANKLNALEHSVVKYVSRHKGDKQKRIEDLHKAIHCIEMLLEWEAKP